MKQLFDELLAKLQQTIRDPVNRLPIAGSLALHVGFVLILSFKWEPEKNAPVFTVPEFIQARVVDNSVIEDLSKARQEKERLAKQKEADKTRAIEEKKRKQEEAAQKKRETEQKKQAEEVARKAEADKKALALKKQQEKALEEEKKRKEQEQQKAKEVAQQKELEKQKEQEKQKALEKQKELEKKEIEKQKALREERERQLEQQLRRAEEDEARRQQERKNALEAQRIAQETARARVAYEESEVARYTGLIKERIESKWRKPASANSQMVTMLLIRLFPTGDLDRAEVVESSGNAAFDLSALNAATSVAKYPVPQDREVFEKNFRQFRLAFSPKN